MSEASWWRAYYDSLAHARLGNPPPRDDPLPELLDEPDDREPKLSGHDSWPTTEGARNVGHACGMHYPVNNPRWQADRAARLKRGSRR